MAQQDRNDAGRFAEGNPGGPGRPRRETERAYLATLAEACPPSTWRVIVERAVKDAKAGDAKAREWLAAYLVGRPESRAGTLHGLAVEEEAGSDPIGETAARWRRAEASAQKTDALIESLGL